MKHSEKITSVVAAVSALHTIACCLPSGIAAAAGAAGSVWWWSRFVRGSSGYRARCLFSDSYSCIAQIEAVGGAPGQHRRLLDICDSRRRYLAVSSDQRWPARNRDSVARLQ
jgi:hypothetical protein